MRFDRVPVGNKASHCLLNATIKHHLSQFRPSKVVVELTKIRTWVTSCQELAVLMRVVVSWRSRCQLCKRANMTLTNVSGSAVSDMIVCEFRTSILTLMCLRC